MAKPFILALDASQIQATVCLVQTKPKNTVVSSVSGSISVAHSEGLLKLIDDVLKGQELALSDLDSLAVGVGPGSFTGVRIGCATIKALAQATGLLIYPFSSLRALSLSGGVTEPSSFVNVAMANAYQGLVFAGWVDSNGQWQEKALSVSDWVQNHLDELLATSKQIRFCGQGASIYGAQIRSLLEERGASASCYQIDESVPYSDSKGICESIALLSPTMRVGYLELHAQYLRPSQAEIKLESVKLS